MQLIAVLMQVQSLNKIEKMKIYILTFILVFFLSNSWACDNSTISIANQIVNGDGSITYTFDITIDLGGGDGFYNGFQLSFISSLAAPGIISFDNSLTAADLTSGNLAETLDGTTSTSGTTSVLSYNNNTAYNAASNDFSIFLVVTLDGCFENMELLAHYSFPGDCTYPLVTGQNCATCDIISLSAIPGACVPVVNTYDVDVIVTYTNEPGSGTLDVNGQSFAITASPQTILLTGLISDGNPVDVTAHFSEDIGCSLTTNSLFTAPAACAVACSANAGTISQ